MKFRREVQHLGPWQNESSIKQKHASETKRGKRASYKWFGLLLLIGRKNNLIIFNNRRASSDWLKNVLLAFWTNQTAQQSQKINPVVSYRSLKAQIEKA